jgi:hypothetical protein
VSNRKEVTGTNGRQVSRHRKEPSWTIGDLAAGPGGLGAKLAVAGLAGVTLALPATSAFASLPQQPVAGSIAGIGSGIGFD